MVAYTKWLCLFGISKRCAMFYGIEIIDIFSSLNCKKAYKANG
jgi:hypothetical protein